MPPQEQLNRPLKILMIDDHPMIIAGYKSILSFNDSGYEIETTEITNCKDAYELILDSNNFFFDLIFLDLSLPSYEEKGIYSGEDLALLIRERYKYQRIIILTSHTEGFLLYNLKKKIQPEGLMVKSDFSAEDLLEAFETVLKGKNYFTKTVVDAVEEIANSNAKTLLDEINREIIVLLGKGVLTKNLPSYFGVSQSTIDKRKAQIRDYFMIKGGTDEDIVREAKKHGFI